MPRHEGTPMRATSNSRHLRLPWTVRIAAFLFLFLGVAFGASVPLQYGMKFSSELSVLARRPELVGGRSALTASLPIAP